MLLVIWLFVAYLYLDNNRMRARSNAVQRLEHAGHRLETAINRRIAVINQTEATSSPLEHRVRRLQEDELRQFKRDFNRP